MGTIKFYIVDRDRGYRPTAYGGIYRLGPYWRDESADSVFNQACDAVANATMGTGGLDTLEEAVKWARLFAHLGVNVDFIAAEDGPETATSQHWPIRGYDVTYDCYHTLLEDALVVNPPRSNLSPDCIIWEFIKEVFAKRLNEARLFAQRQDAERFMLLMCAMQDLAPGSFEEPENFAPKVYTIYDLNKLLALAHE